MAIGTLRQYIYRWSWDTRCRGVETARILKPLVGPDTMILDAGCGELGLKAFIPGAKIKGIDILSRDTVSSGLDYVEGSIIKMPFEDRSYDIAVSVDVLEHLPASLREDAIRELVRVANKAVVITFPDGERAGAIDEVFMTNLKRRGSDIPDWLDEHLREPYPQADTVSNSVREAAESAGRKVEISIVPSERIDIARWLRGAAARSKYLYLLGNIAAGIGLHLLPKPDINDAYRAIIVAEFTDGKKS